MASKALLALYVGLEEVRTLQDANPGRRAGGLAQPHVARAMGRAEVVLLSGHLEQYLRRVNEEAVDVVVAASVPAGRLPTEIRLLHSRKPLETLNATQWDNREQQLRDQARWDAPIWDDDAVVEWLDHERLLDWMSAPKCKAIIRAFKIWGIPDAFEAITRKPTVRSDLWLRLTELVDKRNNIAHGDVTVEATHQDVAHYLRAVRTVCERLDRQLGRRIGAMLGVGPAW